MNLSKDYWMAKNKKQEIWTNLRGYVEQITANDEINVLMKCRQICSSKRYNAEYKAQTVTNTRAYLLQNLTTDDQHLEKDETNKIRIEVACHNLICFFKEFDFTPNFRFVNTLAKTCFYQTTSKAKDYIKNYFKLVDNQYTNVCIDKMKSTEFNDILTTFENIEPKKQINNRFKLYYGAQGTGKTTKAMEETNDICIVCHSAMLPQDLMEDFEFNNGQPTFKPSTLQRAIVNGETIVLDEINLLPFESLRFLQSLLDGKSQFEWKGRTINVHPNFSIIGTMNLQVNGMIYALPEPLVDRASELREFELTSEQLVGAIL